MVVVLVVWVVVFVVLVVVLGELGFGCGFLLFCGGFGCEVMLVGVGCGFGCFVEGLVDKC